MSAKTASPTASLLRSSRIFALPPKIERPPVERIFDLGTASPTPPHPALAAIASPASARSRGDWGLKRSLPNKTLKKSNPTIQIEAQDTIYHATKFDSAARFTSTLQKWQELHMPVTILKNDTQLDRNSSPMAAPKSVFEAIVDGGTKEARKDRSTRHFLATSSTSKKPSPEAAQPPLYPSWYYSGPWLLGMTEQNFDEYLGKIMSPKLRKDFYDFVRNLTAQFHSREMKNVIRDQEGVPEGGIADTKAEDVTPRMLEEFIRRMLKDESLLESTISSFLDLPRRKYGSDLGSTFDHSMSGPPMTHPSAGLSYLRTSARLRNHPTEGPQATKLAPTQARLINPHYFNHRLLPRARVGLAGFVADSPAGGPSVGGQVGEPGYRNLDIETPGGGHVWVQPQSAHVSNTGNALIKIAVPSKDALQAEWTRRKVDRQNSIDPRSKEALDKESADDLASSKAPIVEGFDELLKSRQLASGNDASSALKSGLESILSSSQR